MSVPRSPGETKIHLISFLRLRTQTPSLVQGMSLFRQSADGSCAMFTGLPTHSPRAPSYHFLIAELTEQTLKPLSTGFDKFAYRCMSLLTTFWQLSALETNNKPGPGLGPALDWALGPGPAPGLNPGALARAVGPSFLEFTPPPPATNSRTFPRGDRIYV